MCVCVREVTVCVVVVCPSVRQAVLTFQECISSQQQWRQIHHLCYWELMWCHSYQQQWTEAYRYADLLCRESRWSKVTHTHRRCHSHTCVCVCCLHQVCVVVFQAIYVYQKAAILSMMSEEDVKKTGENIEELFR